MKLTATAVLGLLLATNAAAQVTPTSATITINTSAQAFDGGGQDADVDVGGGATVGAADLNGTSSSSATRPTASATVTATGVASFTGDGTRGEFAVTYGGTASGTSGLALADFAADYTFEYAFSVSRPFFLGVTAASLDGDGMRDVTIQPNDPMGPFVDPRTMHFTGVFEAGSFGQMGPGMYLLSFKTGSPIAAAVESVNATTLAGTDRYTFAISFAPDAAPEPATWGMMIFGFGAAGVAMRRRKAVLAIT